jgi:hypothetical protein
MPIKRAASTTPAMVVIAVFLGGSAAADELMTSQTALICAHRVFEQGQLAGFHRGEAGASVYRDAGGHYHCHTITISTARGAVEIKLHPRAVAIFHTHPPQTQPSPSTVDAALAKRLGIPVYTLQPDGVWRVGPEGTITQEANREWRKADRKPRAGDVSPASQRLYSHLTTGFRLVEDSPSPSA